MVHVVKLTGEAQRCKMLAFDKPHRAFIAFYFGPRELLVLQEDLRECEEVLSGCEGSLHALNE